jgi:hypothetical protein
MNWRDVRVELPPFEEEVVLLSDKKITHGKLTRKWDLKCFQIDTQYPKSNKFCYYPDMAICHVTHWMPMMYRKEADKVPLPRGK